MARLDTLLGEVEAGAQSGGVRALIVRSGKPGAFIAGADVNEIAAIATADEGTAAAREGQRIFWRLERLPILTIAAIDGLCLGGGTELVLACTIRIATQSPQTRIGLPEVRLGILPGFGGTTRLPRLVGLAAALPIILTGSPVDARKAQRVGLVDEAVPPSVLLERAVALAHGAPRRPRRRQPLVARLIDRTYPGQRVALARARNQVLAETRGHYPAPLAVLDVLEASIGKPLERAFEIEARALGRLIVSDECGNLVRVFHLMEGAKKSGPAAPAKPVREVGVIGAGVMGGGIAQLLAAHDVHVRLKDIRTEAITHGLQHARQLFERAERRGRMSRREVVQRMNAIAPALDYSGFGRIDLVIEAVVERLDIKQAVLRDIETRVPDDCVLTTNTSSLSVTTMQAALERPDRFCGMHFFNPVHRMPLVEIVRGESTSDETVATVFALTRVLDKTPVIVNDGPGFLVNRILGPYLNEAGWLLADGATVEAIDRVLVDFGMPMGPLRLLDEIGLDIARHAAGALYAAFGERMAPAPPLAALDGSGLLGRKGGRGFYVYEGEKVRGVNDELPAAMRDAMGGHRTVPADEILDRCVLAMVNEAARILADGIARSPADVDLAMITGTGFPPFRGGLLRWADSLGVRNTLARLEALASRFPARLEPAPLLREYAQSGRGFHG